MYSVNLELNVTIGFDKFITSSFGFGVSTANGIFAVFVSLPSLITLTDSKSSSEIIFKA